MRGLGFALALALAPLGAVAAELTIVPPGGAAKVLSQADLAGLPRESVKLGAKTYEGPVLAYVLRAGGMPVGAKLHGDPLRAYAVVSGKDGFKAVYSLAELDRDYHAGTVILADKVDGAPLADKETPWRLVLSEDKKAWRSVYGVTKIEATIVP
ncbi:MULTISPECIES: hypothetical protein [unclassified Phenylobacterium]|uniref:hypothetical protein n=1 Tax=unclassified Phenylobacterium TaxID=2640670 RepID=UPI000A87784D|nr:MULTISPECIES: hypothetical protein [unclassified Phenylobacterium]